MKFSISKNQWRNYYQINKIILFLIALVFLLSLFPREGRFKYEFQKGKPWQHDDLIASSDVAIRKSKEELNNERFRAANEAYTYFRVDEEKSEFVKSDFLGRLEKLQLSDSSKNRNAQLLKNRLTQIAFAAIDTIYKKGIIELTESLQEKNNDFQIVIIKGNTATVSPLKNFLTIHSANDLIIKILAKHSPQDATVILPILQQCLAFNIVYDQNFTKSQKDQAIERISLTRGMIQKGEKVIAKGELVTETKFKQLESIKAEFESRSVYSYNYRLIVLGRILLIAMALMVFGLFLYTFRHDIYIVNKNIVLLLLLITLMVSITTMVINLNVNYLMAVPICLIPIIVRTFYDTRLALFVHIITIIILGFLVPNSFEFLFMQLITGIITIITVVNLHNRAQFFFTSLMILASYSTIYIGINLMQEGSLEEIDKFHFLLFGISALLTLFSYPLIYIFERIFGMITDVTLIEISDTNSALLRELSMQAPGTFQHSLIVSNIAEEAARAIGANALLARAGALYHDIGKLENPLHFIENISSGNNPHDDLPYQESAEIITSHVIKGVEKARARKLPESIIDFIRTHHGTRLTQYFYSKYKAEFPNEEFDESVFRYRGPIPFSKETSILMMADTIEAASRSLKAPTESQVSDLVDNLVKNLLDNNQLKNSPLTLKEINTIKKIIKKKLLSIYHIRIEYPKMK